MLLTGGFRGEPLALRPELWRALEFPPGLTCSAPNVCSFGVMVAKRVVCGAGRVAGGLALLLDSDQAGRHANVVDVAEHVLQRLQLMNELLALALVEQRSHELGVVAHLLQGLAHFMALR